MENEIMAHVKELLALIDWVYMLAFILLSFVVKKAFGDLLQKITKFEWKSVYTVLALATILAVPWLIFKPIEGTNWIKIIVSYAVGTSFYEIILEYLENLVKRKK